MDHVELNVPYVLMQMGCELIKKWQRRMPKKFWAVPVLGRVVYLVLRVANPWIVLLPKVMGVSFPELTNQFFVLLQNTASELNNKL